MLGEVSQRVRDVILPELLIGTRSSQSSVGLAEQLALAVYLTVAAQETSVELTPEVLESMKRSLTRTLLMLGTSAGS